MELQELVERIERWKQRTSADESTQDQSLDEVEQDPSASGWDADAEDVDQPEVGEAVPEDVQTDYGTDPNAAEQAVEAGDAAYEEPVDEALEVETDFEEPVVEAEAAEADYEEPVAEVEEAETDYEEPVVEAEEVETDFEELPADTEEEALAESEDIDVGVAVEEAVEEEDGFQWDVQADPEAVDEEAEPEDKEE